MVIEAVSGISLINSILNVSTLSAPLRRRLVEAGVNAEDVKNDEEAQAILAQKEETEKISKVKKEEETNGVSYYDKQLMNEARLLALDLGLYVSEDTDMETLLYNISVQISLLKDLFENNDNLKEVAKQFDDRYQNIYSTYMSNRDALKTRTMVSLI